MHIHSFWFYTPKFSYQNRDGFFHQTLFQKFWQPSRLTDPGAGIVLSKGKGPLHSQVQGPCKRVDPVVPVVSMWRRGWEERFTEIWGWEAAGHRDNRHLVESGWIMRLRVCTKIGEKDCLDRFYLGWPGGRQTSSVEDVHGTEIRVRSLASYRSWSSQRPAQVQWSAQSPQS